MQKAVITGASRGIGKATAEKFLKEGWEVVGTSTSGNGWVHDRLSWVQLDLSQPESIAKAAATIAASGNIDVLINNAGMWSPLEEHEDRTSERIVIQALRDTLNANLIGTIDFTERLISAIAPGGSIVVLGSRLGSLTDVWSSYAPSYSISKAGLSMYVRKLASQLQGAVTVSIIDPGWVKTDMGGEGAPREVHEPAEEIFALATTPHETGKFWHQGAERSW